MCPIGVGMGQGGVDFYHFYPRSTTLGVLKIPPVAATLFTEAKEGGAVSAGTGFKGDQFESWR